MYTGINTSLIKGLFLEQMTAYDIFTFCKAVEKLYFEKNEKGNIVLRPSAESQLSVNIINIAYQLTR